VFFSHLGFDVVGLGVAGPRIVDVGQARGGVAEGVAQVGALAGDGGLGDAAELVEGDLELV